MGELISQRSYGRALGRSDGSTFHVNWNDDDEEIS
jgi:hypothetical protein